jgi:hypothetical protein
MLIVIFCSLVVPVYNSMLEIGDPASGRQFASRMDLPSAASNLLANIDKWCPALPFDFHAQASFSYSPFRKNIGLP